MLLSFSKIFLTPASCLFNILKTMQIKTKQIELQNYDSIDRLLNNSQSDKAENNERKKKKLSGGALLLLGLTEVWKVNYCN